MSQQEIVLSDSGSEPEIVMENIVTRPRPVSRGKILSREEDGEDTNTKDLDSIEPR